MTLQGFSLGGILGQAWSALLGVTDRLTDIVYDYVPDDVSRPTVRAPPHGVQHCTAFT